MMKWQRKAFESQHDKRHKNIKHISRQAHKKTCCHSLQHVLLHIIFFLPLNDTIFHCMNAQTVALWRSNRRCEEKKTRHRSKDGTSQREKVASMSYSETSSIRCDGERKKYVENGRKKNNWNKNVVQRTNEHFAHGLLSFRGDVNSNDQIPGLSATASVPCFYQLFFLCCFQVRSKIIYMVEAL